MRLDKYLKVSQIIKRRTIAKELLDLDRATINGHRAKPSSEVNIGDVLVIRLRDRIVEVKVLKLLNQAKKEEISTMYQIISETYLNNA